MNYYWGRGGIHISNVTIESKFCTFSFQPSAQCGCCIFMNQSWNYNKKVLRAAHLWFCLDMGNMNIDSKKWGLFNIDQRSLLDHPPEWFTVNIPCVQFQSNTSMIAYVYSDTVNSGCVTCEIKVMNLQYDNFANNHVYLFVTIFGQYFV